MKKIIKKLKPIVILLIIVISFLVFFYKSQIVYYIKDLMGINLSTASMVVYDEENILLREQPESVRQDSPKSYSDFDEFTSRPEIGPKRVFTVNIFNGKIKEFKKFDYSVDHLIGYNRESQRLTYLHYDSQENKIWVNWNNEKKFLLRQYEPHEKFLPDLYDPSIPEKDVGNAILKAVVSENQQVVAITTINGVSVMDVDTGEMLFDNKVPGEAMTEYLELSEDGVTLNYGRKLINLDTGEQVDVDDRFGHVSETRVHSVDFVSNNMVEISFFRDSSKIYFLNMANFVDFRENLGFIEFKKGYAVDREGLYKFSEINNGTDYNLEHLIKFEEGLDTNLVSYSNPDVWLVNEQAGYIVITDRNNLLTLDIRKNEIIREIEL